MAFDAFVLNAVSTEIERELIEPGARVSRIYQLNPTDIIFYFKGVQKEALFFSINANRGRINLTERHYSHPSVPPPFCMLLRKHLGNGVLVSLKQPPLERVLYFSFAVINENGKEVQKTLAAEIMGRRSNLLLLDSADKDGKQAILGALKPIPPSLNRFRTLLPHSTYFPPPSQEKLHPYALNYDYFHQEIVRFQGKPTRDFLLQNLQGISPLLANEIASRAKSPFISEESSPLIWDKLQEILQIYHERKWQPVLIQDKEGKPLDYSVISPLEHAAGHQRKYSSINKLLDEFYEYQEKVEEKDSLYTFLSRQVELNLKKSRKKEKIQLQELERSREADYYRRCGDLLLLNLKQIPPKAHYVYLQDIYSENAEKVKINLDPQLSASLNAQRYFRKYRQARQGEKKIAANLEQTQIEISYLESVRFSLEKADLQTLREIKEELEETGYLAPAKKPTKLKKNIFPNPMKFISSQGEEIFVGRNNRQNEYLVQHASKTDLWLHVKDMPGAHVIIKSEKPQEETIKEAAMLAAHFSRGAHSSNVAVDFTAVKNLRRIPGAKPGMVTYSKQKTLYVTPREEQLNQLFKQLKPKPENRDKNS